MCGVDPCDEELPRRVIGGLTLALVADPNEELVLVCRDTDDLTLAAGAEDFFVSTVELDCRRTTGAAGLGVALRIEFPETVLFGEEE